MQIKSILAAAALVVAAAPSFAVTTPLTFANGVASFNNVVFGAFSDTFTFSIGQNNGTAVSATNVALNFGLITSFAGTLAGTPLTLGSSTTNGVTVQVLSGSTASLLPGNYALTITGNAGAGASYGGSLIAAAVPEPQTYALMLAGLGAIGFLASRRKAS